MAIAKEEGVSYEPEERPPVPLTVGSGLQAAAVILAPVVLTVVIVVRIAEQPDSYLSWAVFAALLISGATTVLQAVRVGRIGAGHVLIMGTSGAFIAVCVAALVEGGPCHDGEPHRGFFAVSVLDGCSAIAAAENIHSCRFGHCHHVDRGHGSTSRI